MRKASMVIGSITGSCIGNIRPIERLNFTGLCLQDGSQAIRVADLASLSPAGVTTAATWDKDLMYKRGFALGEEFRDKGSHVLLGPVAGPLGRHPLGGRNWKGFSPDPYLTGAAMNWTIRGIQDAGAQACAKHFIGNEQETQRSNSVLPDGTTVEGISFNIDDRTMHELYLWPFADEVKADVASFMCSYNHVNQTYACENSKLLNGLLKGELCFQGHAISDFLAVHSGVVSIEAGLDVNMPGPISTELIHTGASYFGGNVTAAVRNAMFPDLWREVVALGASVENTAEVAGKAVVQLYVEMPAGSVPEGTPRRVLRGFEKVALEPGERREVVFGLRRRDVSFWNITAQEWQIPVGEVAFAVGFSSRDLRESVVVTFL
ncbi:hypothetical protein SLS56_001866 [Neofusicoccum ribis]|uniref:beta-glucosidase n=1 Tax=Neofusicoccum ribis TaxID=45134 RepID=A0ABR3T6B4_9PEZI